MRAGVSALFVLVAFAAGGCGGDDVSDASPDAAVDASPDASAFTITPPTPPAPLVFTPCPDGWYEVEQEGIAVCEPWPSTGRASCAEHEAHFPGRPGCERIGTECPAGGAFSPDVPSGSPVIYVREGATGGDGSSGAPFGTIGEALGGVVAGTTIALAAGSYDEAVELPGGVTLLGACAESTHLLSTTVTAPDPVVCIVGPDARVENVSIGPAGGLGIKASGAGMSVTLRDVVVHDVSSVGVLVEEDAVLDAERLVIRRTNPIASGLFGRGLDVEDRASADVRWFVSEANHEWGVVSLRAELTLSDAATHDTDANAMGGGPGFGMVDGSMVLRRVVSENDMDVGILVAHEGGDVDAEDVVVRDTRVNPERIFGGRSMTVQEGASAVCRRCRFQRSKEIAIMVSGSTATFSDLLVTDVDPRINDGLVGRGLSVRDEGEAILERIMMRRVHSEGILVIGASTMSASDVDIRNVELVAGSFGRAMMVVGGSTVTMDRWEVADLPEAGFLFQDPRTSVTVRDLLIRSVDSRTLDGRMGRGINIQFGAAIDGQRIAIRDVRDVGVAVLSPETSVSLSDISIGPVHSVECAESSCGDDPAGHGLGVYEGGTGQITRFEIADAEFCGVHVADEARVTIAEGTVRGSTIGACVQSVVQNLEDLSRSVRYVDNEDGLVATDLPVPTTLQDMEDGGSAM